MKKMYTLISAVILTVALILPQQVKAQSPQKMSYQAVIRNSSDQLLTNETVGMQISILEGTADGTPIYVETQTPTTNANGLVSIEIGGNNVTVVLGEITAIDWANGPYFIKTETDPEGSANYTITGTSQLLSVPYALHAKTAESITGTVTETDPVYSAWDKSYNDIINTPVIIDSINAVIDTTTQFLRIEVDGDVTNEIQDLNLNSNTLTITNNTSATNIDLSSYLDNTDDQTLSNVLTKGNNGGATQIKNLADPTDNQDAVTKAYVDALEQQIKAMQNVLINAGLMVKDYDGNVYGIVTIGTQNWMTENLKTTKYNDGTAITLVTDNITWSNLTTPAYCWYNNNEATYKNTYGAMYNWYTVNTGNLCPTGWHVPTDIEWTTLTDYIGGATAGGKLKETGTTHWNTPNTGATNEIGFTALPGGYRHNDGVFHALSDYANFWSATENDSSTAWYRYLSFNSYFVNAGAVNKIYGYSVRCIKD